MLRVSLLSSFKNVRAVRPILQHGAITTASLISLNQAFHTSLPVGSGLFKKSKLESQPQQAGSLQADTPKVTPPATSSPVSPVGPASPVSPAGSASPVSPAGPTEQDFKTHPILKRVPKFLHNYASQFINAPFSNLVAFIILHELTAIIPLFGIWYYLHNHPGLIPLDLPQWALTKGAKVLDSLLDQFNWNINSSDKIALLMEGAYSFTIVKLLLPVRVIISLSGMPLFAKLFVLPITNLFRNLKELRRVKQERKLERKKMEVKRVDKPRL
ncbi:hypothetical protein KGF56_003558 [Candida oxycetoniae]|uniref:Uncharacterized protein n=1 Tax=Candida oxycetoniae TaxID=497107 RepID=A0AAI9SVU1_9ASCO|nr:uncharacterized protein KGF56_003558 [Candida oxycetoniae]KAI3403631.2 hypothetical protein KGF56_003558 [Candida oxycetoniae]